MSAAAAKKRRRSATIQYRDIAPMKRPKYRRTPKAKAGKRYAAAKARGWKG